VVRVIEEEGAAVQPTEADHGPVIPGRREQKVELLLRFTFTEEHSRERQLRARGETLAPGLLGLGRQASNTSPRSLQLDGRSSPHLINLGSLVGLVGGSGM
jgi:hypothetical protein